jgi:hypothetical protein
MTVAAGADRGDKVSAALDRRLGHGISDGKRKQC